MVRFAPEPYGPWDIQLQLFTADQGWGGYVQGPWPFGAPALTAPVWDDPTRLGTPYGIHRIPQWDSFDPNALVLTIYYFMSTWNPYQVMLMKSDIQLGLQAIVQGG